jgi:integrase
MGHLLGIRDRKDGRQVFAKVRGEFISQFFPLGTPDAVLIAARKTLVATAHLGLQTKAADAANRFETEVEAYLKAKAGLPTIADRTQRMHWWVTTLGPDRLSSSVTTLEVRQQLEALRKAGKAPGTLNQYRGALHNFFTILHEDAKNPVDAIPKYREVELLLQLPTLADASRAIDLAIHPKQPQKGGTATQARLRVLLWTGWPNAILKQLQPTDIHWDRQTATVHGRKKGGGTKPRTVPLLPQALQALTTFAAVAAWGPFSNSSLRDTLHRGCDRAGVPRFRPYDLRHLLGTTLVLHSSDERGAAELMLHTDPRQTWRYTRQAASPRAVSAIAAVTKALPMPAPTPGPRLVKRA